MSTEDPRCPNCGGKIGRTATYCMHCQTDLTGDGFGDDAGDGGDIQDRRWGDSEDDSWADQTDPTDVFMGEENPVDDGVGESTGGGSTAPSDPTATTTTASPGGTAGTADGAAPGAPGAQGGHAGQGAPGGARETDTSGQILDPDGIVDNTLTVLVGIAGGVFIGLVGTFTLLALSNSIYAVPLGFLVWVASTAHLVRRRTVQGAVSRSAYGVALVLLLIPLVFLSPLVSVEGGIDDRIGGFVGALFFVAIPAGIAAVVGWVAGRFVPEEGGPR